MSTEDAVPHFHDKESEARYWKSRCHDLQDTLTDTENSLHEFMDSSKELEKEMDREITAANSKKEEYQLRAEKLRGDVDDWKTKYQRALSDHNKTLAELNRELTTLRDSHNLYKNKLRDMELDNDELENAERMVASSLNDMETRYNKTIERTAMLEEELVEKSRLEEENQRLKDELQEANEELSVLRESLNLERPGTRTNTPAEPSSSNGRSSVDDMSISDLMGRHQRPPSRSSGLSGARPPSRSSAKHSPPMPKQPLPPTASTNAARRLSRTTHMRTDSRDTRASMDGALSPSLINSPTSQSLRARQSTGPSSYRTSVRATPRLTAASASASDQPSGSKSMIGDMFKRMRALEKRLADTRNGMAVNDTQSAIPRPSSRLGSSIGPGGGGGSGNASFTPRRSVDTRRDEQGTPSSIPVPLSKSTSRRPTSRLSMAAGSENGHIPSSVRCQTPTFDNGATLDFLDQDPSKIRRRSHLALAASTNNTAPHPGRPRGSTLTVGGVTYSSNRSDPLRNSVHPNTGRPAPPPSWKPSQTLNRPRSSSIGSNS